MQISENTREVLKNFAEINQNLLVNPGKKTFHNLYNEKHLGKG